MKKLFVLLVLLTAIYVVHSYIQKKSFFELNERIVVSQASGLDMYAGNTPPLKWAYIGGSIKNTAEKNFANVSVVYTIGYDTVSAQVGFLMAGESTEFKTNSCRVRTYAPEYTLEEIKFEEQMSLSD